MMSVESFRLKRNIISIRKTNLFPIPHRRYMFHMHPGVYTNPELISSYRQAAPFPLVHMCLCGKPERKSDEKQQNHNELRKIRMENLRKKENKLK